MQDEELLRFLDDYVDRTRREISERPGYNDWSMGFVTGMYRVLRRAHEEMEARIACSRPREERDGIKSSTVGANISEHATSLVSHECGPVKRVG